MKKLQHAPLLWLVLIQWVLAYQWLHSGILKFTRADFMANIDKTIGFLSQGTSYRFYGDWLASVDAAIWGNITRFSELAVGLGLLAGGLYVLRVAHPKRWAISILMLALFGGALLNLNFYLAAGFSSQAASGINFIMGVTQLILGAHYLSVLNRK